MGKGRKEGIRLDSLRADQRKLLSRFDLDGDGVVEASELEEAAAMFEDMRKGRQDHLVLSHLPEKIRTDLAHLDKSGDGVVESEELWQAITLYEQMKSDDKVPIDIFPRAVQQKLAVFDSDGDGTIGSLEMVRAAELYESEKKKAKKLVRLAGVLLLLMGLTLAAIAGLTFAVVELSKESKVAEDGAMVSAADSTQTVKTAAQEYELQPSSASARRQRGLLDADGGTLVLGGGDTAVMTSAADGSVLATAAAPLRASRLTSRLPDSAFEELKELDVRSGTGARLVLMVQGWTRLPRGCKGTDSTVVLLTAAGQVEIEDEVLSFKSADSMEIFERAGFTVDFSRRRLTGMYEMVGFFNAIDNWEGLEAGEEQPGFPDQFHTVFRLYYRCYDPANPPPPRSPGDAECIETDENGDEPDAGKLSVCGAEYDGYKMVQAGHTYTWVEGEMWMDGPLSREEYRYPVRAPHMRVVYIVNDTDPSAHVSERKRFFQIDDTPEDYFMERLEASGVRMAADVERNRTGAAIDGARAIGLELGLDASEVEISLRSDGRVSNGTDTMGNATFINLFDLYELTAIPSADPYAYEAQGIDPNATTGVPPGDDPTPFERQLELLRDDDPNSLEKAREQDNVMDNYRGIRMPRGLAGGALSCGNGTFADMGLNASTAFNVTGVYNGDVFLAEAAGGVAAREFLMRGDTLDDVGADVRLFDRALDPADPASPRVPVKATVRYQDQDFFAVYDLFEAHHEYDPVAVRATGLFSEWPDDCTDPAVSKEAVLHRNVFEIHNLSPFASDIYVSHGALMNEFKGSFLSEAGFRTWVKRVYGTDVLDRMVIDWAGYDPDAEEGEQGEDGGDAGADADDGQSDGGVGTSGASDAMRRRLHSGGLVPLVPKGGPPLRHLAGAAMPEGAHEFAVDAFGKEALDDAMRKLDAAAEATIARGLASIELRDEAEQVSALDAFDRSMAEYYAGGAGRVVLLGNSGEGDGLESSDARRSLAASATSARERSLLAQKKSSSRADDDDGIPFMIGISYGQSFSYCSDTTLIGINLGIFGLAYSDPKFCALGVSAEVDIYGVTIEGSLSIDYNPNGSGLEVSGCVSFSVGCSKKICGKFSDFVSYTFLQFCIYYGFVLKTYPYNGGRNCWQSYIKGELTVTLGTCNAGPQVDLIAAIQFDMMMERECEKAKCAETCRQWGEDAIDVWPCIRYTCEPVNTYTVFVDAEISVGALIVCASVFSSRIMKYGPKVMSRGKEVTVSSVASVWGEQPITEVWGNMASGQTRMWPRWGVGGGINCPQGSVMSGYWRGGGYITQLSSVMCVDVPSFQRMAETNANGEENAAHWNFGSSINPWGGSAQQDLIYISNSWWTLDQTHYWTHCPDGYAIKNLTRNTASNCPHTYCIEAVWCARVTHRDFAWTRKAAVIERFSDVTGGWHGCPYDMPYLQGIYQTSCHNTYCWDYFYCAGDKSATWPGMKPRLGGLETKVVDHTYNFADQRGDWMCEHGWNGWVLSGFYRTNGRNIRYLDKYLCTNVGKVLGHNTWNYCSRKGRWANENDHKNCFDKATQMYCDIHQGYVMRGIYTNKGESIHRLEFWHCVKVAAAMECMWIDNSQAFDSEGWSTCPKEYPFMAGLERKGSGAMLSNIDNFLCCRIKATTTNKLAAKAYEYRGCIRRHHDEGGQHYALGREVTHYSNLHPELCLSHCRARGNFQYFGVLQGQWCECYEEDPAFVHGLSADHSCSWDCLGDSWQKCGNLDHSSVYIDTEGPKWEHCASINQYGMPSVQTRCTFKGRVSEVSMRMGRGPRTMDYTHYHRFGWVYKSFQAPAGIGENDEWGVDCTDANFPGGYANEYRYCAFDTSSTVGAPLPSCAGQAGCYCPSGKTSAMVVTQADCFDAAKAMFGSKVTASRGSLVGPASWSWVLPGCSVQSGGDWAVHYNQHSVGTNDGSYTQVRRPAPRWGRPRKCARAR